MRRAQRRPEHSLNVQRRHAMLMSYAVSLGLLEEDPEILPTPAQNKLFQQIYLGNITKRTTLDAIAAGAPTDWAASFGEEGL